MISVFNQYISQKRLVLMLWEGILIALCVVIAARLRFWNDAETFAIYTALPGFGIQIVATVLVFQICFYYNDLYDLQVFQSHSERTVRLWQALGSACIVCGLLYFLVPGIQIGRGVFFISLALLASGISLSRTMLDLTWKRTAPPQQVLILGTGQAALTVARELALRPDLNMALAGFLDKTAPADENSGSGTLFGLPVLGSLDSLQQVVDKHHVSRIVVALEDQRGALPISTLVNLRVRGIPVEDTCTMLAGLTGRVWLNTVRPSWFVYSGGFHRSRLTLVLKRMLDLSLSIAGLILSAPLMLLIAVAVRLDSHGPVLYRQERVGLGGRVFRVLKFRSMSNDAESRNGAQWAVVDDPRVTRVGRILRKFRLDELPQFFNVIRGEMSFVGPRPERPVFVEQLRKAIPYYDVRHSVRPGITGWAQVRYTYGSTLEESSQKLEYDLFYLKNMSILFDCAIVFQTVRIVLFGRGAR
jgi:sugar transferase (PEP-CTERM system associated)